MEKKSEIDQFIRHLQAELEDSNEILDVQARMQRQWQLEITIQESMKFLKRMEERKILGLENIFEERDAVRLVKIHDKNKQDSKTIKNDLFCPKCEEEITEDLGFCESCGYTIR